MKYKDFLYYSCIVIAAIDITSGFSYNRWLFYVVILMLFTGGVIFSKQANRTFIKIFLVLLPLALYFCYLVASTFWSLYPMQTLYYSINDSMYFVVALVFAYMVQFNSFERLISFFRIGTYISGVTTVIQVITMPDMTRLGAGLPFLMVAFPFLFLYETRRPWKKYLPIGICLVTFLISMSRTTLICGIFGVGLFFLFTEKNLYRSITKVFKVGLVVSIVGSFLLIIPSLRLFVLKTLVRFGFSSFVSSNPLLQIEEEDLLRISIVEEAFNLYPNYWTSGMGYMSFMQWYGDNFGITYTSLDGSKEISGANLHNSFQTWALEGGIVCILIIMIILYNYVKYARYSINNSISLYERKFHIVTLIVLPPLLLFGMFHQLHQAVIFYIMIGIVFGFRLQSISHNLNE